MNIFFRNLALAGSMALLMAAPLHAADTFDTPGTVPLPEMLPDPEGMPDARPDPSRVSCQGGKGWERTLRVKPTDISYRVAGSTLKPGSLKPASFKRLAETHQCLGVVLHGPQMSTCVKVDGEYKCSAARFIQIEKRDGGKWTEAGIMKALDRYTEVQCCVKLDADGAPNS